MRHTLKWTALWLPAVLTGTLVVTQPATAQEIGRHRGLWGSLGLAYSSAGLHCDACGSTTRESGVGGNFAIGGTVSEQFLLGIGSEVWTKSESGLTTAFGNAGLVAYLYPARRTGFFVRATAGLAEMRVSRGGSSASEEGFGATIGAGYDIPISRSASLTPTASFSYGNLGEVGGIRGWNYNFLSVGVGITFH